MLTLCIVFYTIIQSDLTLCHFIILFIKIYQQTSICGDLIE